MAFSWAIAWKFSSVDKIIKLKKNENLFSDELNLHQSMASSVEMPFLYYDALDFLCLCMLMLPYGPTILLEKKRKG